MFAKRALQYAVVVGGFVPVGAGLAGIYGGPHMLPAADLVSVPLDSHFRYLSGLLLGIGICFWTTIPSIEKKGVLFRALAAIVFVGGLGRLWSLLSIGIPDHGMLFGLVMELAVTPFLAFWQFRLEKKMRG